jgi:hypothetical protein
VEDLGPDEWHSIIYEPFEQQELKTCPVSVRAVNTIIKFSRYDVDVRFQNTLVLLIHTMIFPMRAFELL